MSFIDTFNQFLTNRWKEVVNVEEANTHALHLYRMGDYWVAFEKSAYLVNKYIDDLDISSINFPTYPFPVIFLCITDFQLSLLRRSLVTTTRTEDYVELNTTPIVPAHYSQWHYDEVQDLM